MSPDFMAILWSHGNFLSTLGMRDDHSFPDVDTEAQEAEWLGLLMRNALGKSSLGGFSGGCWPGGLSHGASGWLW